MHLVEVTRGPRVESLHRGALCIHSAAGKLVLALGDVSAPVYPRSAIKMPQTVPLIESGAADRFGLTDAELAIASGSHSGSPAHTQTVAGMLARAGLSEAHLECGAHRPLGSAEARRLVERGEAPSQLHNNCSGKHAGMLLTAVHLSEETKGYVLPAHPVQQRIRTVLETLTGLAFTPDDCGTDGCGIPNYAMPPENLAKAFVGLATPEPTGPHAAALGRLACACWKEPDFVAGAGRLDTRIMTRYPSDAFSKTGAEGVYVVGIRSKGISVALKIEDGARRASETVVAAIISTLLDPGFKVETPIKTWRGATVGTMRPSQELLKALERVRHDLT